MVPKRARGMRRSNLFSIIKPTDRFGSDQCRSPGGVVVVLISGVAASLGGTSALAWGPQLLHDPRLGVPTGTQLEVRREVRWIVVAALVAIAFVLVLGPGISFHRAGP